MESTMQVAIHWKYYCYSGLQREAGPTPLVPSWEKNVALYGFFVIVIENFTTLKSDHYGKKKITPPFFGLL